MIVTKRSNSRAPTQLRKYAKTRYTPARKYRSGYRFFAPAYVQNRTGVPGRMQMTHRYSGANRITTAAGGLGTWKFAANGLYDPDITYGGHQPMYFDQLGAMYNHYCVVRSKIMFTIVPVVASAGCQSVKACLYLCDDTTAASSMDQAIEKPRSVWTHISHLSNTFGPQNRMSLTWNQSKIFGGDPLADPSLQGNTSSNPSEMSYFMLTFQDAVAAGVAALDITVVAEFTTIWTEMANTGNS